MDDKTTDLADELDLVAKNRELLSRLRECRVVLLVSSVLYIVLLIFNMNNDMKWYHKGKQDAYDEIIKRWKNHGK